jgi:Mg/Co/Ni transporter MgtE
MLVVDLLRYPPNTAGGIMTNEVVTVPVGLTVAEAIEHIRPRLARPDVVYYVYVIADAESRRLEGIVTLRDLLLARPAQPVAEVMNQRLVTAAPLDPARTVAYLLADHQLNALPVIDEDRRLVGIVTIDSAISQIAPETLRQSLPRVFS